MQFGLNWDRQILQLEGMTAHQLPGFSQQAHSHAKQGSAMVAGPMPWCGHRYPCRRASDDLALYLATRSRPSTSIELTQPVLVGSQGSERAAWAWPATTTPKEEHCSAARDGSARCTAAKGPEPRVCHPEGRTYVVESTQDLALASGSDHHR